LASFRIIGDLKARIAELEKLTALQKETIDAQGKRIQRLRKALKYKCEMRRGSEQQLQKEPELFVCPDADSSCICIHSTPHAHSERCEDHTNMEKGFCGSKCIPVEISPQSRPVPTSGTGTVEGGTVLPHDDDIPELYQDRVKAIINDFAKDLGDLTLRVDKTEQETSAILHRVVDLENADREDRIKTIGTALKSLQVEVTAIKNNPLIKTYSPGQNTFTVPGPVTGTGSGLTGAYNPCQDCQTRKDLQQRYPNGYTGDSPCAICPNNPNKVMC
jgi:uncharacterized coiled-coil protein SlyX